MDHQDVRNLIVGLRGGIPEKCDFCGKETPPEQMDPEEAGDWVCWECSARWRREDEAERRNAK